MFYNRTAIPRTYTARSMTNIGHGTNVLNATIYWQDSLLGDQN